MTARLALLIALVGASACGRATEVIGTAAGVAPGACGALCYRDDSVPAPLESLFARPLDPAPDSRPRLVYPLAGATIPANLGEMTVHWRRGAGAGQKYFHLAVTEAGARRHDFYLPCRPPPALPTPPAQEECLYPLPRAAWNAAVAGGAPAEISLVAADPERGTIARAEPIAVTFAREPLEGGVYYWSKATSGIHRALAGSATSQPFVSPGTAANRAGCAGCHAVSRDGSMLAFTTEQPGYLTDGNLVVSRVAAPEQPLIAPAPPTVPPAAPDAATMTLSRDGALVLVSHGPAGDAGRVVVRDTATGREVARLDPALLGGGDRKLFFPDWSPDGREIVATLASRDDRPWSVSDGAIVALPFDGQRFSAPQVVVPKDPSLFHFYPSFSPDGAWIVFASAPLGARSYANPQSRLRLVARAGGPVHELARATQAIGKTSTWPRFLPAALEGGKRLYIVLTSKIDYGFVRKNSIDPGGGWAQLWLAAIDLRRLPMDPSSAPVWLPFQDPNQANLMPVWAPLLACGPQSSCGDAATCESGRCLAR